jgi:hypothetical protein
MSLPLPLPLPLAAPWLPDEAGSPAEILVAGGAPEPTMADAAATPSAGPVLPVAALPVVPEDSFPTAAELDAILAALSGPPPGPDSLLRHEVAAQLGLDAAIAADVALFEAALAALPLPGPEADPPPPPGLPAIAAAGAQEAAAMPVSFDWDALSRDWLEHGRSWMLG